jgi:hypothetical protein
MVIVTSGVVAQSELSPKLKSQMETKVKPKVLPTDGQISALAKNAVAKGEILTQRQMAELSIPAKPNKTGGNSGTKDSFCAPSYTTGCVEGDGFTDFAVEAVQNYGSGCANLNGNGWSEYYSLGPAILIPGNIHTFTMATGYSNQYVNIWIDFNDDLTLTSDEIILADFYMAMVGTLYDVDVTIPANAVPGQHGMRAMAVYASVFTDPCGAYYYGEAEDYTVIIGEADYGIIEGYVTENTGGAPVDGAYVSINNGMYSATSAANGFYQMTDVLVGTWTVNCTKAGYNPASASATVLENQTTTVNFAMTAPTMDISPAFINVVVDPFGTATENVDIDNNGDGILGWNAQIEMLTDEMKVAELLKGSQAFGFDVNNYLFVTFDTDDPATLTTVGSTSLQPFGGDFDNLNTAFMYVINYGDNSLYTVDVATGASTYIGPLTGITGGQMIAGMACDKTTGVMYVSTTDITYSDIYTLDLASGALTLIGTTGIPGLIDIAIDGTGTMYGWDLVSDVSYMIDKSTGASTLLGPLGYDLNYAQGGNWDPLSDQIYLAAYSGGGMLMTLDKTTGALTYIGPLGAGIEMDALAFPGGAENWISIAPASGTVNAGSSAQMAVNFDALDIIPGTVKTANIHFSSNPNVGTFTLPVSMTVGNLQFGHITGTVVLGGALPYNIGDVTQVVVQAGPYFASPDATGYYDITAYPGTYDVVATLYGYETQTAAGIVVPEGVIVPNVDFNMPCLYGIITGTVTSTTTGLPIENATVKLLGTAYQDVTGPDGVYEIIVEAGTYDLKASCMYYASQTVPVVISPESVTTQDFSLADLAGTIVVIDLDATPNGQMLADVIQDFFPEGLVEYTTDINAIPLTEEVLNVFLLLGIYANNFVLTETEATIITTWINSYPDRGLYMEGGDTWAYDTQTSLHSYFNIMGLADGSADLTQVDGIGSYWAGNIWNYSGENNWIDHLDAIAPAINVMANTSMGYNCGVAYDAGTYKTVGASFEITGLNGGPGFNMAVACVMAWFGYPVFTYGTLTGTVTELGTGNPVADANISVGAIASTVTLGDGTYYIEDVLVGTWDVNCTKEGYNPVVATVTIVEDQTTTQDFQLTAPQIVVNPVAVSVTLEPNQSADDNVNVANPGNGPLDWDASVSFTDGGGSDALFDLQFDWPVGIGGGEAGIECDGNYIYTTKWNGADFYRYELNGTYIGSFTCGSASAIRDLTWDGNYFYGGAAANTVFEMDFTNQVVVSTFNAPIAVRAIAYNSDEDAFYANNWSDDITLFNKAGTMLASFPIGPVGLDYYGFDYDNMSQGSPYLWGYAQTGTTLNELVQIGLPSGVETGIHVDVGSIAAVGTGIAGGLAITDALVPGFYTLLGTSQNVDIWGLELCESGPVWLTIDPTSGTLTGGTNQDMTLHFDAMDLLPGFYYAQINFSTDPDVGSPFVDVELHVEGLIPAINLETDFVCTDVVLTWEMPTGGTPDSWNVYRDGMLIGSATTMTYTDEMVDPQVEYGYYITAVYAGEESQPTATETITVPVPQDLEALNLATTIDIPNENDVTLTWDIPAACLSPDGYNVFRDSEQINTSLVTDLLYVDPGVPVGFYEYYIVAVYYFGVSLPSDPAYALITGMNEISSGGIEIFPNPASDMILIKSASEINSVILLNNLGQEMFRTEVNALNFKINVAEFEDGIYFIKLETNESAVVRKLTIN